MRNIRPLWNIGPQRYFDLYSTFIVRAGGFALALPRKLRAQRYPRLWYCDRIWQHRTDSLQPPRRQNVCCGKAAIFRHAVQPHVLINVRECDVSFFLWASLLLPTPIGLLWLVAAGHSSFVIVVKT